MKLIAVASVCLAFILSSCAKDRDTTISNFNIIMTPGQVIPPPGAASTASGRTEATYNYKTKTLSYKVTWNSLTSAVTSMHIHGIADPGLPAAVVQNITGFSTATSGTFSGTLFIDNVVIKEVDFLAGVYYIDIHTTNNPGGELRGQIVFGR